MREGTAAIISTSLISKDEAAGVLLVTRKILKDNHPDAKLALHGSLETTALHFVFSASLSTPFTLEERHDSLARMQKDGSNNTTANILHNVCPRHQ